MSANPPDEQRARELCGIGVRFYSLADEQTMRARVVELMRAVRAECAVESLDLAQDLFELGYKHKDAQMIADDVVELLKKRDASKRASTKPCPECGGVVGCTRCVYASIPSAGAAGGTVK